jgi:hypothetical protein
MRRSSFMAMYLLATVGMSPALETVLYDCAGGCGRCVTTAGDRCRFCLGLDRPPARVHRAEPVASSAPPVPQQPITRQQRRAEQRAASKRERTRRRRGWR